jgi:hypothetical protein
MVFRAATGEIVVRGPKERSGIASHRELAARRSALAGRRNTELVVPMSAA